MLVQVCHQSYHYDINMHKKYWKQVEKLFFQNEGGYRDGSKLQKGKKQGVVTQ